MAYRIDFKKSVSRDFKRIDHKNAKRILDAIELDLSKHPESNPSLKGPFEGLRKFRVGDYRVIYAILDNSVLVLRVQHRKEVYKSEI